MPLAALVGATVLGIVGALVAILVAAAVKVVLAQQIPEHEATATPATPTISGSAAAPDPRTTSRPSRARPDAAPGPNRSWPVPTRR